MSGNAQGMGKVSWQLDTQRSGYSNPQSSQAAEVLVLTSTGTAAHISQLAWQSAAFHRLQPGAASLQLETGAHDAKMLQPLVVPLLDGMLHVDEFELGQDDGGLRWLLDDMLTPVSMQSLSNALGWPTLSGKLFGMVPKVRYDSGELTVGGVVAGAGLRRRHHRA